MKLKEIISERTYIIAEIGQNHQGDINIAKELIRQAKICGADAVKSQKRDIHTLLTPEEYNRPYESPHSFGRTYGEHREKLELSFEQYQELKEFADNLGITFFSSPWDVNSAKFLKSIEMELFKVPSACLTNTRLLKEIAGYGKPIILSTGMSTLDEVYQAVSILAGTELYILHCTSAYPCEFNDINLNVIHTLAESFPYVIGFSGHHRGIAVDVAAVAMGAKILERHFTLDRTMKGSDHAASLEVPGFSRLVRDVRAVEKAMGSPVKRILDCELSTREKLRGKNNG